LLHSELRGTAGRSSRGEKINLHGNAIRRSSWPAEAAAASRQPGKGLEQLWPGARIFDHHGMTETGRWSHECPARPGMLAHFGSSHSGGSDRPRRRRCLRRGKLENWFLTNLGAVGFRRVALPLATCAAIHFDSEPCACGRHGSGVAGRNTRTGPMKWDSYAE